MWDGIYLYEANGNIGIDTIYQIDIEKAIESGHFKKGTVNSYFAPNKMVEDLANDGCNLWTADEYSFCLYQSKNFLTHLCKKNEG